jgi:hypothetical protein
MNVNDLTQEQLLEHLELGRPLKIESDRREIREDLLPEEILEDLEDSSKAQLNTNLKKFQRKAIHYEGGRWFKSGAINKIFIQDLKKTNLNVFTVADYKYKDAERHRTAGKAAAEIYQDLKACVEGIGQEGPLQDILEKVKRLSVYGYASSKIIDAEAKHISTKALKLPASVKFLEDGDKDEKGLSFDEETVERIQQARYEEAILRRATAPQRNQFRGRGYGRGSMQTHHKRRHPFFFGKPKYQPRRSFILSYLLGVFLIN